ncbi:response regulator [Bacteroidota bacterium]
MPIRILIVDDHKLFRQGLANMLSESPNLEIVDEAKDSTEAIEKTSLYNPDIVLMDIGLPGQNGIYSTNYIVKNNPDVKVIALSMYGDKHYIKSMLEAGASGYLFKNCSLNQLTEAIETVHQGDKYLDSESTEILINSFLDQDNGEDNIKVDPNLSERESEILKLIAEGKTTREISESIFISIKTVGTHKQNILDKLELNSNADVIKYALKNGFIHI